MASAQRRDPVHIFSELDDLERQAVITEFARTIPYAKHLSRYSFWWLWLSDITELQETIESTVELENKVARGEPCIFQPLGDIYQGIAPYEIFGLRKPITLKPPPLQTAQPVTASEQAALARDQNRCALTKRPHSMSHPAYIFPSRLHRTMRSKGALEWRICNVEFGQERVERWEDAILTTVRLETSPDNKESDRMHDTDRPQNMITLDQEVLQYWEDDLCVFRPISLNESKTSMELAFHWLPMPKKGNRPCQSDKLFIHHHPYPEQQMGCDDSPGNGIYLYNTEGKLIRSGHIFTMTTDDPVHKPLPSMDLLDMQWMVKRSSRFCGDQKRWERDRIGKTEHGKRWSPSARAWLYHDDPENEKKHSDCHDDTHLESEPEEIEYLSVSSDSEDDEHNKNGRDDSCQATINISIRLPSNQKKSHKRTSPQEEWSWELKRVAGTT